MTNCENILGHRYVKYEPPTPPLCCQSVQRGGCLLTPVTNLGVRSESRRVALFGAIVRGYEGVVCCLVHLGLRQPVVLFSAIWVMHAPVIPRERFPRPYVVLPF